MPIEIDRQDRDRRGAETQAAQGKLQAAFERTVGRIADPAPAAPTRRCDTLKIVAGHR